MDFTKRLFSLDVFRGITIACMIMVNNPGDWTNSYKVLLHADWHGCTPTDWVFPFFLFILGVAIPFALGARKELGVNLSGLNKKIFSRSSIIFGLGLFMALFPNFRFVETGPEAVLYLHYVLLFFLMTSIFIQAANEAQQKETKKIWKYISYFTIFCMAVIGSMYYDWSHLRIPGVLQRIALVYLFASLIFLTFSVRQQIILGAGILIGYWALLSFVPVPGGIAPNLEAETNMGAWLDRFLFSENHLWGQAKTWDPEGLLSTLPAVVTGLLGVWTGIWIKTERTWQEKLGKLLLSGLILTGLGLLWDYSFPINKKIWTSSYVLYVGGLAQIFLTAIYFIIDVKQWKNWSKPFRIFGTNALFAYVLSGLFAKLISAIKWGGPDAESTVSLRGWIYDSLFVPYFSAQNASIGFALLNVAVIFFLTWLLYRKQIFLKV
jgi:predicted acyltransferase